MASRHAALCLALLAGIAQVGTGMGFASLNSTWSLLQEAVVMRTGELESSQFTVNDIIKINGATIASVRRPHCRAH
eukprot:4282872-Amphidinium_carterae.1